MESTYVSMEQIKPLPLKTLFLLSNIHMKTQWNSENIEFYPLIPEQESIRNTESCKCTFPIENI